MFDSALPGTQAQALYYDFLRRVTAPSGPCRHVVVIAGNHDSPAFLDAPGSLLSAMNIHVSGRARTPEEETLLLPGPDNTPELIVCAVPFLRDRDLYRASDGDDMDTRDKLMAEGMKEHYRRAALEAERLRNGSDLPVLATGHLFAAGGVSSDSVRDLCVGSLGQVDAEIFPDTFDYVALGHLHLAQKVHGEERLRYAGSPLPMGFDETAHNRQVCLIHTEGKQLSVRSVPVPCFQRLEQVEGDMAAIERRLDELSAEGGSVWTEVVYTGAERISDLRDRVQAHAHGGVDILRIRNAFVLPDGMQADPEQEALEELDVEEVFERRLREAFPDRPADDTMLEELRTVFREAAAAVENGGEDDACAS